MNARVPIEVLICICATSVIENKYIDDDALLTLYQALEAYFYDKTINETIH
jgi:hypothetical protein